MRIIVNEALERLKKTSSLARIDPKTQLSEWATQKITGGVASNVNSLLDKTGLLNKVYAFSKIMKNIKISIAEERNGIELSIFSFPIVPAKINFSANNIEQTVDTIAGKINYLKDTDFHTISFSTFFPSVYYPFSTNYEIFGIECANIIEEMKLKKEPLKLVITGIGIVQKVYITKFEYNTTSEGDIEFSIEFKEAKDPSIYENKSKYYSFKPSAFNLSK